MTIKLATKLAALVGLIAVYFIVTISQHWNCIERRTNEYKMGVRP